MDEAFRQIYRDNAWNGRHTRSGPGSGPRATERLAGWIVDTVERLGVSSVLDAGCGEGSWFPDIPADYVGVDIVPEAIERARELHPDRSYFVGDVRTDVMPYADLVFTRDYMQHLSVDDGLQVIANVRPTARYLVASTYMGGVNEDPDSSWHAYAVDLMAPPFDMGKPLDDFPDGFGEDGELRDPRKFMGLWKLR